ncbi:MAG: stage II sporulation protein R [Thermacetogeniaceae bacterium]
MNIRRIFLFSVLSIVLFCIILALATGRDNDNGIYDYNKLIRLHVIANSDSKRDQDVKYHVRDALIDFLRPKLKGVSSFEEAKGILLENRCEIAEIARETLRREGFDYGAAVCIGRFAFPARAYGRIVLPAGDYEAVRIVLGEGKGANWWCVLFPPLCFVDISGYDLDNMSNNSGEKKIRAKETAAVGKPIMLRFRVLDWIRSEGEHLAKIISS